MNAEQVVRRLEELIPHASEGEWHDCDGEDCGDPYCDGIYDKDGVGIPLSGTTPAKRVQGKHNVRYIACASPENLKTLIAYVRELEKLKDYALAWHPRQPGSTNDLIEAVDRYREFRRVGDE